MDVFFKHYRFHKHGGCLFLELMRNHFVLFLASTGALTQVYFIDKILYRCLVLFRLYGLYISKYILIRHFSSYYNILSVVYVDI